MKQHTPKPLVLCEGKEDLFVIQALANHAGLEGKLTFQQYGGKDKLRANLHQLKASPVYARGEYSRILVTRDADSDFASSWQALKDSIVEAFSSEPKSPGEWTKIENGPEIAAWIIPGPGKTGMIETLCLESSRANTPDVFKCLDSFVSCLSGVYTVNRCMKRHGLHYGPLQPKELVRRTDCPSSMRFQACPSAGTIRHLFR